MSRNRRFRRSLRRMIFAGLVAGAGFAPAAAAHVSPLGGQVAPSQSQPASNGFVAVGGDLVQRSQVGLYRHEELGTQRSSIPSVTRLSKTATPSGFVAVGGDLVQRSQVGLYRHEELGTQRSSIPSVTKVAKPASSTGFDWRVTIIAVASVTAACLLLAAAYVVRRRLRLTPA
jgi:hypothetical protein